jgi:nucleotide-binding universal stress UspA family protein
MTSGVEGFSQAHVAEPAGVVAGYDGSASASTALEWAVEAAQRASTQEKAAVRRSSPDCAATRTPSVDAETRPLFEQARSTAADEPSVAVTFLSGSGRPSAVLIAEAAGASLAAVGARGRGGFSGLVLGSLSQKMLMHAECPVAVVHGSAESL